MTNRKDATEATVAHLRRAERALPPDDGSDLADARRGFIGTLPDAAVGEGWSMKPYGFLAGPCPATVHAGLWRQANLNAIHGLFEVTPGIFQVRGFDLSNVTFVEGDSGYIVIDPLITAQSAAAALALMRRHRGDKPVRAVIYTHSHVDHFGGIGGVVSEADIKGGLLIVAPEGFLQAAASENVLLGNAMGRRAHYMYGSLLPRDAKGHVDCGLGKATSLGTTTLVAPTRSISQTGETMVIDGVEIVFQLTPDTEAPAEMNFLFPRHSALCIAENCTCTLHNLYTLRGAQVRDARNWSRYIEEARTSFGGRCEVVFAGHHWPKWGRDRIDGFLRQQRDLYKFIHDQTLRMANSGMTPTEIAEELTLPPSLAAEWHTRGFYGTLSHNAMAVYQRYLGWYDGNPANLHKLPPVEAGRRYVELAGGAEALLDKARAAFAAGDYRWVAEVMNHLVFADPGNAAARALQADTLEQLGYQSESGPWRDSYLSGAMDLRETSPATHLRGGGMSGSLSLPLLVEMMATRLDGARAAGRTFEFDLVIGDERCLVRLENAVLHQAAAGHGPEATIEVKTLLGALGGKVDLRAAREAGGLGGEAAALLVELVELLDAFDPLFPIVTP